MEISHDAQLIFLGAIVGSVFSLLIAFAGAHHEDWVKARRKKRELKEIIEFKSQLKEEIVNEVIEALDM